MVERLIDIAKISVIQLASVTGVIVLAGLVLGFIGQQTQKNLMRSGGRKLYMSTAFIGTPVHEIGHAIFCILFCHKITRIKLFDRKCTNGNLGYVDHTYNQLSLYQRIGNFFIAVGPLFSGTVVMLVLMAGLLPDTFSGLVSSVHHMVLSISSPAELLNSLISTVKTMYSGLFSSSILNLIVFSVFSICISSHMALSPADMKGAFDGMLTMFIVLVVVNFGFFNKIEIINNILSIIMSVNYFILFILSISIFLSLISMTISFILNKLT